MRIRVGNISARCERCGCEDFQPVLADAHPADELLCFSCGAATTRRALVARIADETVRQAERYLQRARSRRRATPSR